MSCPVTDRDNPRVDHRTRAEHDSCDVAGQAAPPSTSVVNALSSLFDPLAFFQANLERHPVAFRSGLFGFSAWVIHDPALVRHVLSTHARHYRKLDKYKYLELVGGRGLVTSEGEEWVRQRRRVQEAFSRDAIEQGCRVISEEASALTARLRNHGSRALDAGEMLSELVVTITARALFGSAVTPHVRMIRTELERAQRLGTVLLRLPFPLHGAVRYLPVFRAITTAARRLRAVGTEVIDARRRSATAYRDVLTMLMLKRDHEPPSSTGSLCDEVITLLLAGHETTVIALTWAVHLLSHHPDAFSRLAAEAEQAGELSNPACLDRCRWSRAIVSETMRLYPPAYLIGRTAIADDRLGGFNVRPGTNIIINTYGMHRHPAFWTEPHAFVPERMLEATACDSGRFLYIPFGAGPRACIAHRFAMYEMQIILLSLARAFTIRPLGPASVRPSPRITLPPSRAIHVALMPAR